MSVSFNSLDRKLTGEELVGQEAIHNCKDKTWAGFLCILVLSSVLDRKVIYPDCGEPKFKLLLNQEINLVFLHYLHMMLYTSYFVIVDLWL